ncbi:hypothetical protein APS56_04700 [Pseudalgibacter alginicilyticus]|uniref:Uncharacterized protein n=1 Tax=Pseudalgibacter alginicilyticus TaxID=1736674 RepID=A0A0P0D6Z0_9FLAO|nr:hypothetical protein [Pseudalgibacter alginicilyticus]ALJ04481.1 hypothetical protein APS56_04700 [Pseudalgibacter alginicilyticus]
MKNKKVNKKGKQTKKEALSKLEKIKKLSAENLVLLKKIEGVQEGYYLNYCRVYDYFELFCTIKSTLNVCILALEDQQDLTLDIKKRESDVRTVLEFMKNLIPLEEGIYLDKMRKLMFTQEDVN